MDFHITMASSPRHSRSGWCLENNTGTHIRQSIARAPISSSVYIPNKEEEQSQLCMLKQKIMIFNLAVCRDDSTAPEPSAQVSTGIVC